MNAEMVIEKGSHVFLETVKEDTLSVLPHIIIGVFIFVICVALLYFCIKKLKKEKLQPFSFLKDTMMTFSKLTGFILITFFTYSFCSFFSSSLLAQENHSKAYQTWKKEYVLPYLESLPLQEYEIVDIVKTNLTKDTKEDIQGRVEIVYKKDGKLEVFHGYADIQYTKGSKATFSYIDVPVDLGNGYHKGKRQLTVTLPVEK